MAVIESFTAQVPEADLQDLRERLARTRWPESVRDVGWSYGVPLDWLQEMARYWENDFDWRAQEARINRYPNYLVDCDGFRVHAIRVPAEREPAIPLLLLHGWPSSFIEYLDIIPSLTEAGFEVILPSLPGYGFSEIPLESGWTSERIAGTMLALMDAFGIERFGVHAHDHGASVMVRLALQHPERIIGYHTTEPGIPRPPATAEFGPEELAWQEFARAWSAEDSGYARIQTTRPQTLAYGLNDSPVGLAAWLLDKWQVWTAPPSGNLLDSFSRDELLANVTLYWLTQTANFGGRAYLENARYLDALPDEARLDIPVGVTLVATQGIERVPRAFAARRYPDIRYWHDLPRGGHFVAGEEPELLAASIAAFFRDMV